MVWLCLESGNREIALFVIGLLPALTPLILLAVGAYARKTGRMGSAWWTSLMRWQLATAFAYALPAGLCPGGPGVILFLSTSLLSWGTTAFVLLTASAMLMRKDEEWGDSSKLLTRHALAFVGLGLLAGFLALGLGTNGDHLFS